MYERILLLDLNYHLRRCVHVKAFSELVDSYGRKTGGVFGLMNTIQTGLVNCTPVNKVIGVWDGGLSQRRLSLYPQNKDAADDKDKGYKGTRGIQPGMSQDEINEKIDIQEKLTTGRELSTPLLNASAVHVIHWPEREADDVIAALARALAGTYTKQVIVVSDDWDFAQLCDERICVYRQMAEEFVSLYDFVEKTGVPVDWFVMHKAVDGDKSDNILGVNGVGPKTINEAVRDYVAEVVPNYDEKSYDAHMYRTTCPENLDTFFDWCGSQSSKRTKKIGKKREEIKFNMQLIDLSLEQFPPEHLQMVLDSVMQQREFDEMSVIRQMGDLSIDSLLDRFSYWSNPFRRIC